MELNCPEKLGDHCLICGTGHLKQSSKRGSPSTLIDEELHVIFLLRNILEIPKDKLEHYLTVWGSPSEWTVKLCERCSDAIDNAKRIYQEILNMTRIYKDAKKAIIEIVKKTGSPQEMVGALRDPAMITVQSRKFVSSHAYDTVTTDPFMSGDWTARGALLTRSVLLVEDEDLVKTEPLGLFDGEDQPDYDDSFMKPLFSQDYVMDQKMEPASTQEPDYDNIPMVDSPKVITTKEPKKRGRPKVESVVLLETKKDPTAVHAYDKNVDNVYFCRCGKTYGRPTHLGRHIREHTVLKDAYHLCDICKVRKFKRKEDLKRHVLSTHEGVRPICPTCGKRYKGNGLNSHFKAFPDHKL